MERAGFKEWAVVCEAIGRGEQSVILRKGGIAEGRDGFAFRHREFFLFPTFFHEQVEKIRGADREIPPRRSGEIEIRYFVKVDSAKALTDWQEVEAIEPLHVLTKDVVRERFYSGEMARLHVAFISAYRLEPSWVLADSKSYGGCRSWVTLPALPDDTRVERVVASPGSARL